MVPADQPKAQITLTVPSAARDEPYILQLEGHADMRGRELVRPGVPAEDMMQAFAYQHLVPAENLVVYVSGKAPRASRDRGQGNAEDTGESAQDSRPAAWSATSCRFPTGPTWMTWVSN